MLIFQPAQSEICPLPYSTRWRVSVDAVHAQQIGVVKGGVLMVATSSLVSQPDTTAYNRGLRLQSQRVVATLTNRPQDYANISRATYRPVNTIPFIQKNILFSRFYQWLHFGGDRF
jgi:hypothetical protein